MIHAKSHPISKNHLNSIINVCQLFNHLLIAPQKQIFRHVTVANFAVPMLSVFPPISTAMAITTALMKVTRLIARPSHVPTTNSSVRMVDPTERQSASQNRSFVTERKTARMELTRSQLARQLPALPSAANTNAVLR